MWLARSKQPTNSRHKPQELTGKNPIEVKHDEDNMPATDDSVASFGQPLRARPPQRREIEINCCARTRPINDKANRDQCGMGKWKDRIHPRTVHFDQGGQKGGEVSSSRPLLTQDSTGEKPIQNRADGRRDGTSGVDDTRNIAVIVERKVQYPAEVDARPPRGNCELGAKSRVLRPSRINTTVAVATTTTTTTTTTTKQSTPADFFNSNREGTKSNKSSSRRAQIDSQVTEIYFCAVDINKRQISLGAPTEDPDRLLTPTQASYDEEPKAAAPGQQHAQSMYGRSLFERRKQRLNVTLKPAQVDRLVKALAACPLLHMHVRRQWWDDEAVVDDDTTVMSDLEPDTPSLTSVSTLYSQSNQAFLNEHDSPSMTEVVLQEEDCAGQFHDHPKAKHPVAIVAAATRSTKFGGIAITDPRVHGTPIRFISENFRLGANVLRVGSCTFLKIPYGTTVQSNLRVETPSSVSGHCRVMLQVVNQVLERKTGRKTYLLVAELDVTESFTKAALAELADYAQISLAEIQLATPAEKSKKEREQPFDWCSLADDFHASCNVASIVEAVASSFAKLTAESCTMQTLSLMSELEQLKNQHQDFLVIQPTGYHGNGMVSGIYVPWTSQHLDHMLSEFNPYNIRGEASQAARTLRERVVNAVAGGCAHEQAFDTRIWWGDQMRHIKCVPLVESGLDSRPTVWVCFLSDLGRYAGALLEAFYRF